MFWHFIQLFLLWIVTESLSVLYTCATCPTTVCLTAPFRPHSCLYGIHSTVNTSIGNGYTLICVIYYVRWTNLLKIYIKIFHDFSTNIFILLVDIKRVYVFSYFLKNNTKYYCFVLIFKKNNIGKTLMLKH